MRVCAKDVCVCRCVCARDVCVQGMCVCWQGDVHVQMCACPDVCVCTRGCVCRCVCVFMGMLCVCVHVCARDICVQMCVCLCVCAARGCVCVQMCTCACPHVCVCMFVSVCARKGMCVCAGLCAGVCVCTLVVLVFVGLELGAVGTVGSVVHGWECTGAQRVWGDAGMHRGALRVCAWHCMWGCMSVWVCTHRHSVGMHECKAVHACRLAWDRGIHQGMWG